jgi:phage terminase Nu1 subunit (DNA packaging protein)
MATRTLTRKQARAALGDMPERSFARLVSEGLPRSGEGQGARFPWPEIYHWVQAREREKGAAAAKPADLSLAEAERRERVAKAELAEIKARQLRGELVEAEAMREELRRVLARLRAGVLSLSRYAPRIVGLESPAHAVPVLQEIGRDLLTELQRTTTEADVEPDDESPEEAVA